jgi:DNA-binding transcriptional LysR family regulator
MKLSDIDLNLLVLLDALLRERSVSRAAKRLGMRQPALSKALERLRKMLNDPLLVRTAGGMVPTPRAVELEAPLRRLLEDLHTAIAPRSGFDPATTTQSFKIAATDYAALALVPRIVARVRREAPSAELVVRNARFDDLLDDLRDGVVDLYVGLLNQPPAALYATRLLTDRFVCLVRADHPTVGARLTLKQYVELPHLLVSPVGGGFVGWIDHELARLGMKRRIMLSLQHFLVAPHVVCESDLIVTLPECIARKAAAGLPVRVLAPPVKVPTLHVRQFWHARTHQAASHRWFRALVAGVGGEFERAEETVGEAA